MQEQIERFRQLAEKMQGAALTSLITEITGNPKVFHFSQFAQLPSIKQLETTAPQEYLLLDLFCHHDFNYYRKCQEKFPKLDRLQLRKLKQLSIISLCESSNTLNMRQLMKDLLVTDLELIDMLIEICQLGLAKLKINERTNTIRVQYCVSRDIKLEDSRRIANRLVQVIQDNTAVLALLDKQIDVAQGRK